MLYGNLFDLFDAYWMIIQYYSMFIWWLFDEYSVDLSYLVNICKNMQNEWLTQFCTRQATLPQHTDGQVCTASEGNLWFAWFVTAKRPPRILMSVVRIRRTRGCKLAITVFAFEIQESFGLFALRVTLWTEHWQPQPVQRVSLSKLVSTRHCNNCRKRTAMAEFAVLAN